MARKVVVLIVQGTRKESGADCQWLWVSGYGVVGIRSRSCGVRSRSCRHTENIIRHIKGGVDKSGESDSKRNNIGVRTNRY